MGPLRQTSRVYRRAGVTLTELLVAISVIVVLVGLTFTMFTAAERAIDSLETQIAMAGPEYSKKRSPRRPPKLPDLVPNQYIVTFKRTVGDPKAEANRLGQSVPAQVLSVYTTAFKGAAVRIQPGDLAALRADPAVARVEQDQKNYLSQVPTGVKRIQYSRAPATPPFLLVLPTAPLGTGPRNLTPAAPAGGAIKAVAVIDSGIDVTHPELNVVFTKAFGFPDATDQNGHGTHVSGTIGARGIKVTGVFPGVPLWGLRAFDAGGAGFVSDSIAAIDFVTQNASQISVCNMSFGGGFSQAENDAVDAASNAGVVMCAAAGNSAQDVNTLSPASAPTVICVAALADSDGIFGGKGPALSDGDPDDTFASFSCFGAMVTVIAPGVDIFSTKPLNMGSYSLDTGTSMATPHVAGYSALLVTYGATGTTIAPGGGPRNLGPTVGTFLVSPSTPAQVKAFLVQESVEQIPGLAALGDTRSYPMLTGRP